MKWLRVNDVVINLEQVIYIEEAHSELVRVYFSQTDASYPLELSGEDAALFLTALDKIANE